ncbi:baculoviral IAP repeat-containing protein 5.1 isoform X1 [Nilaparvata lugens]|uniref:baculoviral IAP repeat-containing protein 5.1 isoform X1 n=1 Tax=Nilaparvata lugens TaxID=108931 RepID=UPI00193C8DEC|nr:baculoviral IAP repeat-containing protein 5.1 isoform X1 [Nilaparvata lugens]
MIKERNTKKMELFNRPDDIMFWTKTRLQTFKYWPFDDKVQCNAKRMAAAGFYATGGREEPDLACCFVCKKSLNGWKKLMTLGKSTRNIALPVRLLSLIKKRKI